MKPGIPASTLRPPKICLRQAALFLSIWLGAHAFALAAPFEWPPAEAAAVGIDPAMLAVLDQKTRQGDFGQVKSLMLLRHGKLVYEAYFRGHGPNDLFPLYSVTKSWASAVIGIAIMRGDISGVDEPLDAIFHQYPAPFLASPAKRTITLQDVLTMRHGLAWDEWSTWFTDPANPVNQMTKSPDWWAFVLDRPMTAPADSVFRYSTGVSNLLGGVVWTTIGQSAAEFALDHLFGALDINEAHIEVDLSGGPRGSGITQFQPGLTPTGHGLWLKTRDLAKLGQLYLDRGAWDLQRLVPSEWIEQSWRDYSNSQTDPQIFPEGAGYGYQWWSFEVDLEDRRTRVHMAEGWAGQFVLVVPELDLVLASNADNGQDSGPNIVDALRDIVVPAVEPGFDPRNDGGLTGSWYSPDLPHQGFMLEVVPTTGQVVLYWMTFEPATGKQQWMIAVSLLSGRRTNLELLRPVDGAFIGNTEAELVHWGEAELEFLSCTTASLAYASADQAERGTISLQRLTPNSMCSEPSDK